MTFAVFASQKWVMRLITLELTVLLEWTVLFLVGIHGPAYKYVDSSSVLLLLVTLMFIDLYSTVFIPSSDECSLGCPSIATSFA